MSEPKAENKNTIRLNRFLAMCGIGARRKVEAYIDAGRVTVNGRLIFELGYQVCESDIVMFDDLPVAPVKLTYLIFNKPKGILSAVEDSREQTVIDILPPDLDPFRLFPVGRLDRESEGLLLLTNDGMFSQQIIHPSAGITKTYEVELRKPLGEEQLIEWTKGVNADGLFLKPQAVRRLARKPMQCWFEVVLNEGIKREIRLMVRTLGNDVRHLIRRKIGKLVLSELQPGEYVSVSKEKLLDYIKNGYKI